MRRVNAVGILFAAGLALASLDAAAAELRKVAGPEYETHFLLTGPIGKGDVEKFRRILPRGIGGRAAVRLDSSGGDQAEGWRVARLFGDLHVATVVPAGATCAGACALAFLGGTGNGVENTPERARVVLPGGKLRFQSPFPGLAEGVHDGVAAARAHADSIRMVALFIANARSVGLPEEFALEILRLAGSAYREPTVEERERYGIGAGPDIFPEHG
jgi:hypothetical protein